MADLAQDRLAGLRTPEEVGSFLAGCLPQTGETALQHDERLSRWLDGEQAIAEERRLEVEALKAELAEARKPWWQKLLGR